MRPLRAPPSIVVRFLFGAEREIAMTRVREREAAWTIVSLPSADGRRVGASRSGRAVSDRALRVHRRRERSSVASPIGEYQPGGSRWLWLSPSFSPAPRHRRDRARGQAVVTYVVGSSLEPIPTDNPAFSSLRCCSLHRWDSSSASRSFLAVASTFLLWFYRASNAHASAVELPIDTAGRG